MQQAESNSRRVVITGLGLVSPLGSTLDELSGALVERAAASASRGPANGPPAMLLRGRARRLHRHDRGFRPTRQN